MCKLRHSIAICFCFIFLFCSSSFSQSGEQITITSYYPSPSGQYSELRFFPHNAASVPCDAAHTGYVFYNSTPGVDNLAVCRYNSSSSSYDWAPSGGGGYWQANGNHINNTNSGNVGIGTSTPGAKLTIQDGSILSIGTAIGSNFPSSGPGWKLMYFAPYGSFRVGAVTGGQWDQVNTGQYSFATGFDTIASGSFSVATGNGTAATGNYAVAMGVLSSANGDYSAVIGAQSTAGALGAMAFGDYAVATGVSSKAIGSGVSSSGNRSTAIGWGINVQGDGSFGIGIGNPGVTITQPNSMAIMGGNVGIGVTSPLYPLHMGGGAYCDGITWVTGSDRSFKKNLSDLRYGLKDVLKLKPREFDTKQDNTHRLGFIAQEVEKIVPEVVSGKEGAKGIAYGDIVAILVNAIKEQQDEIDDLKSEIHRLKSRTNGKK
jgi:hypothetical protein